MAARAVAGQPVARPAAALHPLAWVAWLLATVTALLSTNNPLYLAVILLCIAAVLRAGRAQAFAPALPLSPWRFGLIVVTLSAAFNGLMAHFGQTVLFTLPAALPLLGGPVTLEAIVYGAINGLVLTGIFAAFLVLYQAVPTYALVRMIPRAFYPVGVVLSVAIAYVPTTLAQFGQIREVQRVRGHAVRGARDWLPLAMPLLVSGLERAMQLAEAMTARGFGSDGATEGAAPSRAQKSARLLLAAGLAALLAGVVARLLGAAGKSDGLIAAGGLCVAAALWLLGRRIRRTVYRPQPWTAASGLLVAGALLTAAVFLLPLPGLDRASLNWTPYPVLKPPVVDWMIVAGATLGLLTPVLAASAFRPRLAAVMSTRRRET